MLRSRLQSAHGRVITLTGIYHRRGLLETNDLSFARRPYHRLAANNQAQKGRLPCTLAPFSQERRLACHACSRPDAADPALANAFWAACEQMTGETWQRARGTPVRSRREEVVQANER